MCGISGPVGGYTGGGTCNTTNERPEVIHPELVRYLIAEDDRVVTSTTLSQFARPGFRSYGHSSRVPIAKAGLG